MNLLQFLKMGSNQTILKMHSEKHLWTVFIKKIVNGYIQKNVTKNTWNKL